MMMDTRPAQKKGLVDGSEPLIPVTSNAPSVSASSSAIPIPSASTPVAVHPQPQLGQCVYVLSPWRRGRAMFTASQPPQGNTLLRLPHPTPVGLLRLSPYRPYFPTVPSRTPGAGVPREYAQDFRYAHDFYNTGYPTAPPDYNAYNPGQEHVQQPDDTSTSQPNYDSMYPAYSSQPPMYPSYGQQCWGHPTQVAYTDSPDKTPNVAYYPQERVPKAATSHEYDTSIVGTSGTGNMTKKSVRVKFVGPETMYMTTKTLGMQRGSMDVDPSGLNLVSASSENNMRVYDNLRAGGSSAKNFDLNEVVEASANQDADDDPERVAFNSIEEALAMIDPTSLPDEPVPPPLNDKAYLQVSAVSYQGLAMADEKQEEVIKAAKSLFSKRTRTLYHWLYPDTSKNKLKATVSAAWDTLAETEKKFYVSQVLGRFGLQASSLMINPQLDGIKGLPTEVSYASERSRALPPINPPEPGKLASAIEAQQAVDQLFASCAGSESWTSYSGTSTSNECVPMVPIGPLLAATSRVTPPTAVPQTSRSSRSRAGYCGPGQTDRRKKSTPAPYSRMAETGGRARLVPISDQLEEEVSILKRMRESKLEAEFEEDAELNSEIEKFRMMAAVDGDRNATCRDGDDFWRRTPDPDDLFTQLEF